MNALSSPVIAVRGLNKFFGDRHVVKNLSLTVAPGEIFGFLGPNGSGKTTSIRMLCGLLTPDSGTGTCLGLDIRRQSAAIRRHVGYMTQRFSFWEDLTIRENLAFTARIYGVSERRAAVERALTNLDLHNRADQLAGNLSGGWKQRLALAACMLHNPRLLLLDEPTAGVDPKARRDFWNALHHLAGQGISVLVSTHYMDEAERCHKLVYIADGVLLAQGTAHEMIHLEELTTFAVSGAEPAAMSRMLDGLPGVEQTVPFGTSLHVTGQDGKTLAATLAGVEQDNAALQVRAIPTGLEEVFIHLMGRTDSAAACCEQPVEEPPPSSPGPVEPVTDTAFSFIRWWGIVLKEFLQLQRDRMTFGMTIGLPIVQVMLFGFAINMDPKHMHTAVLAGEHSEFTRSFLSAMDNSGYFSFVEELPDEDAGRQALEQGRVQFVLTIPPDFSRRLVRGEQPSLLLEADATDPAASSRAVSSMLMLIRSVSTRDFQGPLLSLRASQPAFDVRVHNLYNPEWSSQYNIIPGLIGTVLNMTMVMMTGLAMTRERESGTMENLLAAPVKPLEVISGKIVPYVFIGLTQVTLILLAARFLFHVPCFGSLVAVYASALLFISACLAMGITFSSVARNQMQAMQLTFFYFLPGVLISGFMFPFSGMPSWAQYIGNVLPITHFLRLIRSIMLKGTDLWQMWVHIWPIALFSVVAIGVAVKCYKKNLD
jgi:ABC-type multidrug transport system, ATPase component